MVDLVGGVGRRHGCHDNSRITRLDKGGCSNLTGEGGDRR